MKKLLIRTDSSSKIGTGHIMRCIALAQSWRDFGGQVGFITNCDNKTILRRIADEGFSLHSLESVYPDQRDLASTLRILKELPLDNPNPRDHWLVLDGYHFDTAYQEAIRQAGHNLLIIDDYNHLEGYCADIVLNQNVCAEKYKYNTERVTSLLLGSKYALLRNEFLNYDHREKSIPDKARNILVTIGGADPDNVTNKIIESFIALDDSELNVKVILGPANTSTERLKRTIEDADCNIELLQRPNMPELIDWADIAVSAAGSTVWELCYFGVPMVLVTVAENQRDIAIGVGKKRAALSLGWYDEFTSSDFVEILKNLIESPEQRGIMSLAARDLIDGMGSKEVIRQMLLGDIYLQAAKSADGNMVLERDNAAVFRSSFSIHEDFSRNSYSEWFDQKMKDPKSYIYTCTGCKHLPVGHLVVDINNGVAEIDCLVDRHYSGIGLDKQILKSGVNTIKEEFGEELLLRGKNTSESLSITICSDKESWLNAYIPELIMECLVRGHQVAWCHDVNRIPVSDLAFYLGCGQMIPQNILSANKHNLVVHESALPKGKGWSPLTWQILEGKNEIPITLFEAAESVDSGEIYLQELMVFSGYELIDHLRQKQAKYSIGLCLRFLDAYPEIIKQKSEQKGKATYYRRRSPADSQLDIDKSLRDQFNLLRVVDNDRYPAFFEIDGHKYILKIEKRNG